MPGCELEVVRYELEVGRVAQGGGEVRRRARIELSNCLSVSTGNSVSSALRGFHPSALNCHRLMRS